MGYLKCRVVEGPTFYREECKATTEEQMKL